MDATGELGRNPVSKDQIHLEYGNEQAGAGRDCRARLARPNSQARVRTGKYSFSCPADHVQDWQPYLADPYSCYVCMTIHYGDHALLRPTGIQVATKSLSGPINREHQKLIGVKTMSLGTNYSVYGLECCQHFRI